MELQNKYVNQVQGVALALLGALILGVIVKIMLGKLLAMDPFSVAFSAQPCSTAGALLMAVITFLQGIRRPAGERPYRFEAFTDTLWGMMCILGAAKLLIYYLLAVLVGTTVGFWSTLPVVIGGVIIWLPVYLGTYDEVWKDYYAVQAYTEDQ